MSMVTYPLNNIEYTAEDAELFHSTRTSGVYATDSFDYSVTGADNSIVIGTGIAWIKNRQFSGKVVAQKEPMSLDMGLPDPTYPRIDAVVIQFNSNKNATEIVVKNGAASSFPIAPEVVRTESLYELHLYHVRREAGSLSISAPNITDLRNNNAYCGLMSDSITQAVDSTLSKNGVAADAAAVGNALAKKAPAGYGYGGTPKTGAAVFSNLSEMGLGLTASCTTEAFVKALKGHSNVQFMHNKDNAIRLTDAPFDYGTVEFHKGANDNYIYGIGVDTKGNIYVYKYHPSQTDTNGWYYDNPPMADGVEYRTTERYNGRVVYIRLVNMGKLTAGGITKVDVNLGSKIIRYAANNDWAGVPVDEETGFEIRVKKVCPTYIEMFSGASNTKATAHVLVWYFK